MHKQTKSPAAPAAHDEFHGIGGSYEVDPTTGKRTRVEEHTAEAPPPQNPNEAKE